MPKIDRKLRSFTAFIQTDAETDRRRIADGLEAERDGAIQRAEADIRRETDKRVTAEASAVRKAAGRRISLAARDNAMRLHKRREEIKTHVMNDAVNRVRAYVATDKYAEDVRCSLTAELARIGDSGEAVVVSMNRSDIERITSGGLGLPDNTLHEAINTITQDEPTITQSANISFKTSESITSGGFTVPSSANVSFETSESIIYGGYILTLPGGRARLDRTIDAALREAAENFTMTEISR